MKNEEMRGIIRATLMAIGLLLCSCGKDRMSVIGIWHDAEGRTWDLTDIQINTGEVGSVVIHLNRDADEVPDGIEDSCPFNFHAETGSTERTVTGYMVGSGWLECFKTFNGDIQFTGRTRDATACNDKGCVDLIPGEPE